MSASYLVDLGNTCQLSLSVFSGAVFAASGAVIGQAHHMGNANTLCNVLVAGTPIAASGQLRVQVQTSDTNVSGSFTDPTSGLAALPTSFSSGGILIINSGSLGGGVLAAAVSGQHIQSGFMAAAGFQRPHTFVRANVLSGDFYAGTLGVGFISQGRTTGSGGGFTLAPTSGNVDV